MSIAAPHRDSLNDDPCHPLVRRLINEFDAQLLDQSAVAPWVEQSGARVVLLVGDPVRRPEGLDVAVVLPELIAEMPVDVQIGVVHPNDEKAVATQWGSWRWPTLLFFVDGQYRTAIGGMHDWDDFVQQFQAALQAPPSRPPSVGVAVVSEAKS